MWRCEGPHCSVQKRPRTFASALQSVAAVEASKNLLSRDFWCRSIFDFCNNIGTFRTSVTGPTMSVRGRKADVKIARAEVRKGPRLCKNPIDAMIPLLNRGVG